MRIDERRNDQLRDLKITRSYLKYPEGSALIEVGETKVVCTASIEEKVPPFLRGEGQGWVTAEYAMLPRSTQIRSIRDGVRGKVNARSQEIQRLIGRSLRCAVDLNSLGERTIWLDCDVLQADGGTRTAAITGAFVALVDALDYLRCEGKIARLGVKDFIAATSCGIVDGEPMVDLCFKEDFEAEVDLNLVMTGGGRFVEIQGTAENEACSRQNFYQLLDLAANSINEIIELERQVLNNLSQEIGIKENNR